MKPKNFPARKLARQIAAEAGCGARLVRLSPHEDEEKALAEARKIRTKKSRGRA